MRKKVFLFFEATGNKPVFASSLNLFLVVLIILNVFSTILESVKFLENEYGIYFYSFEVFSVIIFTLEYILRIWSSVEMNGYKHPVLGRLRYAFTSFALVDLLAILPFYLTLFTVDLRFVRILRVFRLMRIFKLSRYITALNTVQQVFIQKREQLLVSIAFIFVLLIIISSIMYTVEHEAQPEIFSSIPQTMWWGVSCLTTVGYGDMFPITALGKILGGMISVLGIGLFALPTGILASGFSDAMSKEKKNNSSCPSCGFHYTKIEEQHSPVEHDFKEL